MVAMPNRRDVIVSGTVIVLGSAFIDVRPAGALNLGKIFKGVATTIVHGVGVAVKPVEQLVRTSAQVVESTVKEAGHSAERTLAMINSMEQQATSIVGEVANFAQQGIAQVIPMFANAGFLSQQLDFVMTQAGRVLSLGGSMDDELRADPNGFVDRNSEMLIDYVNAFPQLIGTTTINAGAGQFGVGQVLGGAPPPGRGYYPSVLSLSDIIKLVTLLAA